jgi:hypothetical protein
MNTLLRPSLALPALIVLALPACSGEVVFSGQTSASSGTGGAPSTSVSVSASDGEGGGVTSSGVTGSSSVTAGAGGSGGGYCGETNDSLAFVLATYDGHIYGCADETGDIELSGQVVKNFGNGDLVLDSCGPAADCSPMISNLTMKANGLSVDIPVNAYVRVQVHMSVNPIACQQRIQITNLPSWEGVPNPVDTASPIWVAAADGDAKTFPDSALQLGLDPQGCFPNPPPTCGPVEDFLLHLRSSLSPGDPGTTVPMGATVFWNFNAQGQFELVQARNLRSFAHGLCEGQVDVAYWITHTTPLD